MSVLIEMNNGQQIPLMWYIFILLIFRILALENIAKILTTGPRLRKGVQRRFHDARLLVKNPLVEHDKSSNTSAGRKKNGQVRHLVDFIFI